AAKKRLADRDQMLRDFKMQNLGELPEQQSGNLAIMTSLQTQLQNTMASMSRAQEQRAYLESLLSGYQVLAARNTPVLPGTTTDLSPTASPIDIAQNNLIKLQAERAKLTAHYTPTHPDVIAIEHEITWAQTALEQLRASLPKTPGSDKPATEPSPSPSP